MAIDATTQRSLEIALGDKAKAAEVCDAIDANTVDADKLDTVAAVSTTTSEATTTNLHTMVKAIVAAVA
ncbi:hypothetical protein LCGC14_2143610 [marine sediment metagenome]|uniref:Uncharacterized protein n=1 Tax=marine sediment metagenome TaxID=412755 RepID=A0A0F9DXM0_9ZZZZ|nr:hypothetical protein [Phycisphaerae bacterium]